MKAGIILVVIGALFLLKNLGIFTDVSWNIVWPIVLIVIGLAAIVKKAHGCGCGCNCFLCKNGWGEGKGDDCKTCGSKTCDCKKNEGSVK